jgi:HTH-type transcriptional regulator, competence development regulator
VFLLCSCIICAMPGAIEIDHRRLKQLRRERALSQRALSGLSGVSLDAVNRLETGKRRAQLITIRKLAEALGVEPKELMKEE